MSTVLSTSPVVRRVPLGVVRTSWVTVVMTSAYPCAHRSDGVGRAKPKQSGCSKHRRLLGGAARGRRSLGSEARLLDRGVVASLVGGRHGSQPRPLLCIPTQPLLLLGGRDGDDHVVPHRNDDDEE